MTRIIAGSAGGRTLKVPASGTRPTSDRVRESLFSALDSRLLAEGLDWSDCAVLDLYAGSGALGLEALSRGARSAELVEKSRAAATLIEANATALGLGPAHVHCMDARSYAGRPGPAIDIVFADPPYEVAAAELGQILEALADRLSKEAIAVIERPASDPNSPFPAGWDTQTRRIGDTALWYGRAD